MSRKLLFYVVLALFAGVSGVFAQEELIVFYHGEQTTFQELEEQGIITHCMDDISQPGSGVVICFDSREERNAAFEDLGQNELDTLLLLAGTIFFYPHICYSGDVQYTVPPNQPTVTASAYSIWRDGQIAVELFRLPNYDWTAGTWVVADSHCTLGSWAGTAIKSAKQLW